MSIMESIVIGVFVMVVVFVVLIALSVYVRLQSAIIKQWNSKSQAKVSEQIKNPVVVPAYRESKIDRSAGELSLIGVDEKTAAMVMAIISDRLQIPLGELKFKSIKALD